MSPYPFPSPLSTTILNSITLPLHTTLSYNHPSPHHSYLQPYPSTPPFPTTIFLPITLINYLTPHQTLIYNHPSPYHFLQPITLIYNHAHIPSPLSTTILLLISLNYNLPPPHHLFLLPSFPRSLFIAHHSYLQPFPSPHHFRSISLSYLPYLQPSLLTTLTYKHINLKLSFFGGSFRFR